MSEESKRIIKEVDATMALEGMPLSDFDIELLSKYLDGELTKEELFSIFNKSVGIKEQEKTAKRKKPRISRG